MVIEYKHTYAGHCESGATSGLLRHSGMKISEPMAFGIGSGLYFTYLPFVKAQEAPLYAFRILPGGIFKNATRRLNVGMRMIRKFRDEAQAMQALDENLQKQIPTGVQVSTFHLKYFPVEYRLHYNFHNIVVFGKADGIYHVAEPVRETTQILAREDLQKARFARGLFGPKGRMYYVTRIEKEADLRNAIEKSIRDTAFRMTGQRFPYIGVRGIQKLSGHMKRWPEKLAPDTASFYLLQFIRSIEEFGTGGAGYRYIYGAFLKESAELLDSGSLMAHARTMGQIANAWREFSYRAVRFHKNRDTSGESFLSLSRALENIGNQEKSFFHSVRRIRI